MDEHNYMIVADHNAPRCEELYGEYHDAVFATMAEAQAAAIDAEYEYRDATGDTVEFVVVATEAEANYPRNLMGTAFDETARYLAVGMSDEVAGRSDRPGNDGIAAAAQDAAEREGDFVEAFAIWERVGHGRYELLLPLDRDELAAAEKAWAAETGETQ